MAASRTHDRLNPPFDTDRQMHDLPMISSWFDQCTLLDAEERDSLLDSIEDTELANQLRTLLDADTEAELQRFLSN